MIYTNGSRDEGIWKDDELVQATGQRQHERSGSKFWKKVGSVLNNMAEEARSQEKARERRNWERNADIVCRDYGDGVTSCKER